MIDAWPTFSIYMRGNNYHTFPCTMQIAIVPTHHYQTHACVCISHSSCWLVPIRCIQELYLLKPINSPAAMSAFSCPCNNYGKSYVQGNYHVLNVLMQYMPVQRSQDYVHSSHDIFCTP